MLIKTVVKVMSYYSSSHERDTTYYLTKTMPRVLRFPSAEYRKRRRAAAGPGEEIGDMQEERITIHICNGDWGCRFGPVAFLRMQL